MLLQGGAGLWRWRELRSGRRSSRADLCDGLRVQGLAAVVVMAVCKACVLAWRGRTADWRALHLLQRFVTADVRQAAVPGSPPSLWAVHWHVAVASQHIPRAEVAQNWRAHLRGPTVALLGRMQHAVNVAGAGWWPARWRFWSFSMPTWAEAETEKKPNKYDYFSFILYSNTILKGSLKKTLQLHLLMAKTPIEKVFWNILVKVWKYIWLRWCKTDLFV